MSEESGAVYGFTFSTEDPGLLVNPFVVQGRRFTELVFRPIGGGPDVLMRYDIDREPLYQSVGVLHDAAFASVDDFYHAVLALQPPADVRVPEIAAHQLGWSWHDFAFQCSRRFHETDLVDNNIRVRVNAYEAFGTILTMREARDWSASDWRANAPHVPDVNGLCLICYENMTEVGDVISLRSCQHVFHRRCIYPWIWSNIDAPTCPNCRVEIY